MFLEKLHSKCPGSKKASVKKKSLWVNKGNNTRGMEIIWVILQ